MESCLFLHLLYMRPLLTFIFCLLSASMFAQVKFRQELSEAVRIEVLDTLKPGELRLQIFELDSLKRLIPYSDPEFSYLISESKLSALIERHQDSLGKNYSRCIYLYKDLYENHLEIAIAPYYWDEAQEIFAEFPEGHNKFRKRSLMISEALCWERIFVIMIGRNRYILSLTREGCQNLKGRIKS